MSLIWTLSVFSRNSCPVWYTKLESDLGLQELQRALAAQVSCWGLWVNCQEIEHFPSVDEKESPRSRKNLRQACSLLQNLTIHETYDDLEVGCLFFVCHWKSMGSSFFFKGINTFPEILWFAVYIRLLRRWKKRIDGRRKRGGGKKRRMPRRRGTWRWVSNPGYLRYLKNSSFVEGNMFPKPVCGALCSNVTEVLLSTMEL